jgi:antitoxin StbD
METIHAEVSVSITELKKNPSAVIEHAGGMPVAVLNHNRPAAYLVPADLYAAMMEKLEDLELAQLVKEREQEPTVKVSLDEL